MTMNVNNTRGLVWHERHVKVIINCSKREEYLSILLQYVTALVHCYTGTMVIAARY